MTNSANYPTFRFAFLLTLIACIALAAIVAVLWLRLKTLPAHQAMQMAQNAPSEPIASVTPSEPVLAPIQISPQRMQSIGVKIGTVQFKPVSDDIRLYGNVQADERRIATVQTRFPGWIRTVDVDSTGELVRKGQPLFTIYSPDIFATEQEYLLAKVSAAHLQRSQITGVASGATALLDAAKGRLLQWDIPSAEIAKVDETSKASAELTVNSPVTGYVIEKNALPNLYVQPETKLYTLADLSDVWVYAQAFQSDSGRIKPGDPAEITVDTYPGKVFNGHVDYLLPQVDVNTRTVPVRMVFENPNLQLKPGMFVNAAIKLPAGKQLVIPTSAVFRSGTRNLVFAYSDNGNINPLEVELGSQVGDEMIVQKGLKAGEQIVASANFLIDSESQLQAAAGAFTPPPPGAGAAAAMNAPPPQQANIEMTTDPMPPHKGSNTVRVRVTSQDGKAITGATVMVTFFMPAMPQMGMAAMKTVINATDKGGGMYDGKGDLGSGGTWQVTVTASQNGQTIANKQMTLNATGGM